MFGTDCHPYGLLILYFAEDVCADAWVDINSDMKFRFLMPCVVGVFVILHAM